MVRLLKLCAIAVFGYVHYTLPKSASVYVFSLKINKILYGPLICRFRLWNDLSIMCAIELDSKNHWKPNYQTHHYNIWKQTKLYLKFLMKRSRKMFVWQSETQQRFIDIAMRSKFLFSRFNYSPWVYEYRIRTPACISSSLSTLKLWLLEWTDFSGIEQYIRKSS